MLAPMRTLLALDDLRGWTQETIADDDVLAANVILGASYKVADAASHLDWLDDAYAGEVPYRATLIANLLAKRSYQNPNSIIAEGGVGPIGGDRYVEEFAKFLTLTATEIAELEDLATPAAGAVGGLSVITMENRPGPALDPTYYAPDLDPRADVWPVGTIGSGVDDYAFGG